MVLSSDIQHGYISIAWRISAKTIFGFIQWLSDFQKDGLKRWEIELRSAPDDGRR